MTAAVGDPSDSAIERTDRDVAVGTVPVWLDALARSGGDHACVASEEDSLSYAQLDRDSRALARGLLARGVGKGTRVGILFGNGTQWVLWWAAISRIGAICTPLSTFLTPPELARVIRHGDLHLLIAQSRFLQSDFVDLLTVAFPALSSHQDADLALLDAPFLRGIVITDGPARPWARDPAWLTSAGEGDVGEQLLDQAQREVHPDEEALCIFTSGQSADPKGVFFSHTAIVTKAAYLRDMFGFTATSVTEVALPFFWVGGLVMALFPTMAAGGTTRCTQRSTWGAGAVIGNPAANPAPSTAPPTGLRMMPALGMTETFGMYSWGREWAAEPHPLAAPLDELQPGFELRLADENGREVAEGTPGEILLRGPTMATRLHKVSRADAFDDDGFYRTGDLAVRHGARISFLGRIQDMIKTSGANVSPAEVERELANIDGVDVAHVVGVPDRKRGQLVAAAVVRSAGSSVTADIITDALRQRLSVYKIPKVIVFLSSPDEVPMTASMKVRKRRLAELVDARRSSAEYVAPQ